MLDPRFYCHSIIPMVLAAALAACSVRTAEERLRDENARLAPEAEVAPDGSAVVRWPDVVSFHKELVAAAVELRVPTAYKPVPTREWPYTDDPKIESLFVTVVISGIEPWSTPPPIHPEIYDGPRLYSSLNTLLGKKPESMDDPKTRANFEKWRENKRRHKRVELRRNVSLDSVEQRSRKVAFLRDLYDAPGAAIYDSKTKYLLDGEVGGLRRYSRLYCYSDREQSSDPLYRQILEHKQFDDPSPATCVVNRNLAVFVSPSNATDWVFIECSPLGNCDVHFQAGRRAARMTLWAYDIPRWRETVTPVRDVIDSFVVRASDAER
jgi:hypothetical protein